ncbi:MAG TPA: trypsin-like peptidase domain-containing protein [Galbitalea sp.]|jgi:S1-C subfamily serine protease|nr:trypsin-like peptidase domain-containing protein [Galbitalea sp.]
MTIDNNGQYVPAAGGGVDPSLFDPNGGDPTPRKPRRAWVAVVVATVAILCIGGLGTAVLAEFSNSTNSGSSSNSPQNPLGSTGSGGTANGPFQGGGRAIGQQATAGESIATPSTAAQEVGLVTINTVLDYNEAEQAAGTGMIISSDGYILTNNHVIDGASSIRVTVASSDTTYTAKVVGSDSTGDVAVLKLVGASGLQTVNFAPSAKVSVGDSVYSVGNAEGTGHLVTAVGSVGAVDQALTIGSEDSDSTEHLTGMIQLQSDVVSGDSGGALFNKNGDVIGMVTAASSGSRPVTGDAINIAQVLTVVDQIEAGAVSSAIVYGTPSFIGVDIPTETSTLGVPISATVPGFPAAKAGIVRGDIITAVNGFAVTSATALSTEIRSFKVGTSVYLHWLDSTGGKHTALVTLVAGPAS